MAKREKKEKPQDRELYVNVEHPNGEVETFFMRESAVRRKYGEVEVDDNGYVIIEIKE